MADPAGMQDAAQARDDIVRGVVGRLVNQQDAVEFLGGDEGHQEMGLAASTAASCAASAAMRRRRKSPSVAPLTLRPAAQA